ncbi:MAG: 50S ribosomal protein L19e, partial [Thermoplasmataceae archaeon]
DQVVEAASRSDIRDLIGHNVIQIRQKKGNSNYRLKKRILQRSKERRRGPGSIKGTKYARFPRKDRWVKTVRALRDELRKLKSEGTINSREYRRFYLEIKGGSIRSRSQLVSHVKSNIGRSDK